MKLLHCAIDAVEDPASVAMRRVIIAAAHPPTRLEPKK